MQSEFLYQSDAFTFVGFDNFRAFDGFCRSSLYICYIIYLFSGRSWFHAIPYTHYTNNNLLHCLVYIYTHTLTITIHILYIFIFWLTKMFVFIAEKCTSLIRNWKYTQTHTLIEICRKYIISLFKDHFLLLLFFFHKPKSHQQQLSCSCCLLLCSRQSLLASRINSGWCLLFAMKFGARKHVQYFFYKNITFYILSHMIIIWLAFIWPRNVNELLIWGTIYFLVFITVRYYFLLFFLFRNTINVCCWSCSCLYFFNFFSFYFLFFCSLVCKIYKIYAFCPATKRTMHTLIDFFLLCSCCAILLLFS